MNRYLDCATSYIKRVLKVVKPSINIIFRKLIFQNIYVIYKICYELYIIVFIYFKNIKISNMIVYKVHKICYEVHIICEYIFKMD